MKDGYRQLKQLQQATNFPVLECGAIVVAFSEEEKK